MPRKTRARKNNYRKKTRSNAQVKKLAKQAVNSMKPMKRFSQDNINEVYNLSSNQWFMLRPTAVPGAGANSLQAENSRLSNQCWIHRCSGIFHVKINPSTLYNVEFRKMCGYYKGGTGTYDTSPINFNITHLHNSFPHRNKRYDPDNFKIIEDKTWDMTPKMIFDSSSGDSISEDTGLSNDNKAVWAPLQIKCNFNFNKVFRYTDADDADAEGEALQQNGISQVGWVPFIAIQMRCPDQAFTDAQGNNPAPMLDYKFTTYFKDNL